MEYAIALIDRAAKMCGGSYYKLSKEWGVPESRISEYRHGKARVPLKKVPKLAHLADVDPQEAYLQVAVEQMPEGSEERDLLGKPLAAIAAVMLFFFVVLGLLQPSTAYATSGSIFNETKIVEYGRRCLQALRRLLFRARSLTPGQAVTSPASVKTSRLPPQGPIVPVLRLT